METKQLTEKEIKAGVNDLMKFAMKSAKARYGVDVAINYSISGYADRVLKVKPQQFLMKICEVMEIEMLEVVGNGRTHWKVHTRLIAAKLLKLYYPTISCTRVAMLLGKDHTTVLYWYDKFDQMMENEHFNKKYSEVAEKISKWTNNKMLWQLG